MIHSPTGPRAGARAVMLFLWVVAGSLTLAAGEPVHSPPEMLADAQLSDVFFLDADRGWAVGDRGVILITEDGGRRWELADSPVNCRLESIFFLDAERGWAVGGWSHPYTHKSSAVVLRAENGGRRWSRIATPTLPKLRKVRFTDARHGWAIGNASAMYPAGLFLSEDGGRSWRSVASSRWHGWNDADGLTGHPLAVGPAGVAALADRTQLARLETPATGLRQIRSVHRGDARLAWMVGDGGLVLGSRDGGRNWQLADNTLPPSARWFEFQSITSVGPALWAVGAPGSCVFHSPDAGASWQLQPTGQTIPLESVFFVDERRGWCVGDLGTILATRDGGKTWIHQRGTDRVAAFGVFATTESVPLELFARLAGDEGYLSAIEVVATRRAGSESFVEAPLADRVHEAVVAVGASSGEAPWRFPLPSSVVPASPEALIRGWDAGHFGGAHQLARLAAGSRHRDSVAELEAHLVRQIRQWRPSVVITEHPGKPNQTPLQFILNQVVLAAIERAGDETSFPEQLRDVRLPVWRPQKVFASSGNQSGATLSLDSSRLATRLGRTLADYAASGRGQLNSQWSPPPRTQGFDLLVSSLPRDVAARDFFSGTTLTPGQGPRRPASTPVGTNLESLSKAAQKERNIQQLLRRAAEGEVDAATWLAQLDDLLGGLPATARGQLLFQLGQHYREAGRFDLATETLWLMVQRHPDHALTEGALVWLLKFQASREVQWALLKGTASAVARPGIRLALPAPKTPPHRQVVPAAAILSEVATPADLIQQTRPTLVAEPAVRSCLAAIHRHTGNLRQAHHLYQQLASEPAVGIWSRCGRGELWLANRSGRSPNSTALCTQTSAKPYLDGVLDDAVWSAAEALPLTNSQGNDIEWSSSVQLARDDQYLYCAISCQKARTASYDAGGSMRKRDAELTGQDRMELLLDVDRDYATYFKFTIDHRGWTSEDCFGETRWNPEWFVASQADEHQWIVELAIPLDELVPQSPGRQDVWAIGIQRTIPGVGFQSWTRPAASDAIAAGFGYLRF